MLIVQGCNVGDIVPEFFDCRAYFRSQGGGREDSDGAGFKAYYELG